MASMNPAAVGLLHAVLPVSDLAAACAFYDPLLALVGLHRQVTGLDSAGYGEGPLPLLWLRGGQNANEPDRFARLALLAPSRDAIVSAQQLVSAAGYQVVMPVGLQPLRGARAWALEWLDGDGNRLCLVCLQPAQQSGRHRDPFADSGHGESPDYPSN